MLREFLIIFLLAIAGVFSSEAQTTGGVFGPEVLPHQGAAGYRIVRDLENERFAQRVHIQSAIGTATRSRLVLQVDDELDAQFVQAELLWNFKRHKNDGWASGIRWDVRITASDSSPHSLGVNWTNEWRPSEDVRIRAVILTGVDIGPNRLDGLRVETRSSFARRINNRDWIGIDSFNSFGRSTGFGKLSEQRHRIGPTYQRRVGENWSMLAGTLFGASEAASDLEARFWVERRF